MKILQFSIILLFSIQLVYPQNNCENFRKPMDIPLILNGTFGELRSNHFHSGMDFSTQKKTGIPVYASEDGVVNRIKVSPYGYGLVVYVRHPNGYTTVYAHLESFAEPIAAYVKKAQYDQKTFEIELFPLQNELKILKSQIIGYSGNSGSSGGPHLHYEIRETESEAVVNPYTLGLFPDIKDTQKPIVNGLWVYPKHDSVVINQLQQPMAINYTRLKNDEYMADKIFTNGEIGFGINSYDILENSFGKNGIFDIKMFVNGKLFTHISFDKFKFSESRYINHYIDYAKEALENQKSQKLFNKNNHPIPIIKYMESDGFLKIDENTDYQVKIVVSDFQGNAQIMHIPISYKAFSIIEKPKSSGKYIDYYRDYIFEENNKSVSWSSGTFYEDTYLEFKFTNDQIILGKDHVPLHKELDIRFDVSDLNIQKDKAFIARIDGNKTYYNDTWKRDNDFRTKGKTLGTYQIVEDTIAPTIDIIEQKNTMKESDILTFKIDDALSGIDKYNVYINGEWALFYYDYKTKLLTHPLSDGIAKKGNNIVKAEVTDKMGNSVTFEHSFILN